MLIASTNCIVLHDNVTELFGIDTFYRATSDIIIFFDVSVAYDDGATGGVLPVLSTGFTCSTTSVGAFLREIIGHYLKLILLKKGGEESRRK